MRQCTFIGKCRSQKVVQLGKYAAASLHKNCILLNSRLVNLFIQREKDVSLRFGTYCFAKERSSQRSDRRLGREQESCSKQNDGRLIPFMPSKVSGSAKEIQNNLTLSTKNNVFITFQVSFKSVNRSGNKQFTPYPAGQVYWRLTRYFTMCENVHITDFQENIQSFFISQF